MARKFAAVVFSLGCLQASSVMALGLGELTLDSFLNEPLNARVDLLNIGGLHQDEIKIRLATKEDFDKLGLHRAYFLTSITFEVVTSGSGTAQLVISSDDPVLEPYLDFIVEARWPSGRLLREYTILVDPPVFNQSSPVISISERVAEVEGVPAPVKKTQDPAAVKTSGTQVDVKKSDLAPGEMPERDYNAAASAAPMPGHRYMIHRDDTLWEIALQAKPEGASVHQTMLDIQRINPDAFIDGNINRVKAGYIVYLPDTGDISSADLSEALAEVRQQNNDWREGRASQPRSSSGPSLRISAQPDQSAEAGEGTAAGQQQVGTSAAAMEDLDKSALDDSEAEQRLVAMEQQVETLQRIVSLKDDQIAALQSALAEADASTDADGEAALVVETGEDLAVAPDTMETVTEVESLDESGTPVAVEVIEEEVEPAVEPEPVVAAPAPVARQPQAPESGTGMSYIAYILGAAALALLGFIFMRRRGGDIEQAPTPAPQEDVFADVQLESQELEVEAPAETEIASVASVASVAEEEELLLAEEEQALPSRDSRGYGERKHDEYASDVDTGDALAEADIYIAYGRYPQAIDLLNNAIGNEPGNPAYRLKLLEMYAEMGDRDAATAQFAELQAIDDPGSLSRGQEVLDGLAAAALGGTGTGMQSETPLDLTADTEVPLEADFSGLEIESTVDPQSVADDLDLTADFAETSAALAGADEDLVIAAESNGMSTKLDLARAYLDMGDDDGAREILEEVVADATDELKAEAEQLLGRIG
jgi:pilus assembly protein FimV